MKSRTAQPPAASPGRKTFHGLYRLLQVLFWGGAIVFIAFFIRDLWISLKPESAFSAEKGIAHWAFTVHLSDTMKTSVLVPFTLFQPINPSMFSPKAAYVVSQLTVIITGFATYLYSIWQIRHIIGSIRNGETPFQSVNVLRLKRLGIVLILHAVFSKLILNILCWLLVNHIFSINLGGISLIGILTGMLVLVIAEVFRHGVLLQEEHDTTI
ncbi:DUF2975 domain-containing protein [Paenibacillus sp. GCM10027626]|uniref:DUF2975 domain-containing protein n=1 Tax=Paenibacillus sp. GCM10027626 TaxID=3273411 RepID=UPI00363F2825